MVVEFGIDNLLDLDFAVDYRAFGKVDKRYIEVDMCKKVALLVLPNNYYHNRRCRIFLWIVRFNLYLS